MVYVGRPVADLIRWNAQRGEFGNVDTERQVEKRLAHMRAGTAYTYQRERRNGQVFSIHGQPMTGGGYVTTYSDITDFKRTEQALRDAKQGLEERVEQRTRELSQCSGGATRGQAAGRGGQCEQDAVLGRRQPRFTAAAKRRPPVCLGPRIACGGPPGIAGARHPHR